MLRRQTCTDQSSANHRARRSNERIGAVIDIEQSSLRALQQNRFAPSRCLVKVMTSIAKERRQALDHRGRLLKDGFCVERLATVSNDDAVGVFKVPLNP